MLQRYEIIKKANGQIVWKTHVGPNSVSVGNCIILEDILFIDPRQNEQLTKNRRPFLANLQRLPKWDQTRYYCPKLSLHDCKTGSRPQAEKKRLPGEEKTTKTHTFEKGNRNRNEFKLKISDVSKNRAMDFTKWVWKCIAYAVALILLTISLFFNCLTRIWKAIKGKWHSKKGKRSFIDHYDD